MSESWFSDEALAKQAALERGEGTGGFSDLIGIWEPRTQPTDNERCHHCGGDARDGAGGDWHFCGLCLGRDRDEYHDDDYPDCARHTSTSPDEESADE